MFLILLLLALGFQGEEEYWQGPAADQEGDLAAHMPCALQTILAGTLQAPAVFANTPNSFLLLFLVV